MATLVLGVAGQALGQAVLGSTAFSLFGASISGAAIGGAIGGAIGSFVDNQFLMPSRHVSRQGPRLADISLQASQEGAAIPRVYGSARLAGQLIWASRFLETKTTQTQKVGGKGGGGTQVTQTDYAYSISFAVGLCEGPIAGIGRIWADGNPLDAGAVTMRVYRGTEDQAPDSIVEAIEGTGNSPAYRGLAYVVFEDLQLAQFGNRVPQLQFEVFRPIEGTDPESLEKLVCAVALGPGSGEFVTATEEVLRDLGGGASTPENVNNSQGRPDILVSLDQLQQLLPQVDAVTLVVCWFGSDLRADHCLIKPGVEVADKTTYPLTWSVDGVARTAAHLVSRDAQDRPNFGGTPADIAILQAIAELKSRNIAVYLYPFLMMDIPAGNGLADPYGGTEQSAFPWRGRITCSPAPSEPGSPDKTAAAATAVGAFFGSAASADFAVDSSAKTVSYTGSTDWGYRRFILHYAHLAALAGGVDGIFIGTELKGLTTLRSDPSTYPAVEALVALAADVRSIVGTGTKISYAADWSEYFGHHPDDGSGDVFFHLDPLWSSANIDAVSIDLYHPLSDWRDGESHLDYVAGYTDIHARDYLKSNVEGGEGYDWYYTSDANRDAQARTAITDGIYGTPWVFRYKDIRAWWSNAHYNRPGGTKSASPTAWEPQSKPIWFSELGCPAIDKGSNEPNLFYDSKSSESGLPCYSDGDRDDLIQRRYLESQLGYWRSEAGNNPTSSVYSAAMIDTSRAFLWTWDARPYPDFPVRELIWSDGPNWRYGHWLNGRIGSVPLGELVAELCGDDASLVDTSDLSGLVQGYVIDRPMSARGGVEPLAAAYHFDAVESEGLIRFRDRKDAKVATLSEDGLAAADHGAPVEITRAQEGDLPAATRVSYIDVDAEYRVAAVAARKLSGASDNTVDTTVPIVASQSQAQSIADMLLQAAWVGRERGKFSLPPSLAALEPGDLVDLELPSRTFRLQITSLNDGDAREAEAVSIDKSVFDAPPGPFRVAGLGDVVRFGRGVLYFLDLPLLPGVADGEAGYYAACASPWPGSEAIYKSVTGTGYVLQSVLSRPAVCGALLSPLYAGPTWRFDDGNSIYVQIHSGGLASADAMDVLSGANACAVQNADGEWELIQFLDAELTGPDQYLLKGLLRGQLGTEGAMRNPVATGAAFVLVDAAVRQAGLSSAEAGLDLSYQFGPAQKPVGDVSYASTDHAFALVPSRCYSPVHVKGERTGAGDITITWIRRTRIDGDDWDQLEVPLGEASEAYELDVMSAGAAVRTLSATAPAVTYTLAQQTTDFGGAAPNSLDVNVYQISATRGRGAPCVATLYL